MQLELEEAVQFQNDLFMALVAALDKHGGLKRDDLANFLSAVAQNSRGNRQDFFHMIAKSCRSSMPPILRIVPQDD